MVTIFNMKKLYGWKIFASCLPIVALLIFFYLGSLQIDSNLDFNALYNSLIALKNSQNPYKTLNLNPPIFFILFKPLSFYSQTHAYMFFSGLMVIALLVSLKWTFKYFSPHLPHKFLYILALLCCYPTMTSFKIGQLTPLIYFLIIGGYHAIEKKKELLASILWGLVITLKLFPGLLLFFLWHQKKYNVLCLTLLAICILSILPLPIYDITLYKQYCSLMSQINWYSHSWNFSLFGLAIKLFFTHQTSVEGFNYLKLLSLSFCIITAAYYFKTLYDRQLEKNHCFLFSLCMMLVLSPLAWQYYLILLFIPLVFFAHNFFSYPPMRQILILASTAFLIFPYNNDFVPRDNLDLLMTFIHYGLPNIALLSVAMLIIPPQIPTKISSPLPPSLSTPVILLLVINFMILFYTYICLIKYTSTLI